MSTELTDKITALESKLDTLAGLQAGNTSEELKDLKKRLAKLKLSAIVKQLQAEREDYKQAVNGLNEAIAFIGEADQDIRDVAKTIEKVAKAAELADKAINALA